MKKQLVFLLIISILNSPLSAENMMQVYRHAQQNDAQTKASEANYRAVLEKKPQALSGLKPQINLSGSASYTTLFSTRVAHRPDDKSAFLNLGYTLNLTQPLYRKSVNIQIDQVDATISKARATLVLDQQNLIIRVADAYLAYLKAKDNLKFAKLETKAFKRQFMQVKAFFDAERSAITDVKEAQARYDLARSREVSSVQQIQLAKETLKAISGYYYKDLLGAANRIPLLSPKPNNINAWSQAAAKNSPKVQMAKYAVAVAEESVNLARANKSPTVDLFARHSTSSTYGESSFDQDKLDAVIGIQLNIPLYTGGNTASKIREARHKLQQARYLLEAEKRNAIQQTRASFLTITTGLSQLNALQQALKSNQIAARATQTGFEVGTRTAVDVLLSVRETFRAQRDYSNARYDFLLNTLKLKQATGILRIQDLQGLSNLLTKAIQ
ncbi:MAG TPA: type I secretion protein TolC [Leucothrix mucor]|uniref:Type I secretion protein TolC n=1 Tax=Leucothrix mucor TaxID=45248 RepID=A0A7V2T4H5_LEUMU|nr:type I secretion protein TolC [Leucothrix mucor]